MSDASPNPAPESAPVSPPVRPAPRLRWWPALVLLLGFGARVTWTWHAPHISIQARNLELAQAGVITFGLLLLWVLFGSRLRWPLRFALVGAVLGALGLSAALFRIRGVTGDLLPILEPRWQFSVRSRPGTLPAAPAPRVAGSTNDYPGFLGPQRNATLAGPVFARDWRVVPPTLLWRQPLGAAWSGFALAGNVAATQEQRGPDELVVAYDLTSGKILWSHADAARYQNVIAGEGPRATPSIGGGRVFALGATGLLNCLELATGRVVWSKNILADNGASASAWGTSGSPLLVDDRVVVSAGGPNGRSLVAYAQADGARVWSGGNDGADYSSPLLATLAGVRQVLIFNPSGLTAHAVATGEVLWSQPWPGGHPHVAVPLVLPGDRVVLSSGYGTGIALLAVRRVADGKFEVTQVWKTNRLKAKFANLVQLDGFIYGLDDGILACLDAATGELKWKDGRYGHGQVILVGGLLLLMAEAGDVALIEPAPAGLRELTRFPVFADKTWNPPALAGDLLVVRNDKEAACYRLPVAKP